MTPQEKLFAELRQVYLKIEDQKTREMALSWLVINRRHALTLEKFKWRDPETMELAIEEFVKSLGAQFISTAAYVSAVTEKDMGDIITQLSSMVARHLELHLSRAPEKDAEDAKDRLH